MASRRAEIDAAVEVALADRRGANRRHALIMGGQRTGRTSVLREAARVLRDDHAYVTVDLKLREGEVTRQRVVKALLIALVEALVAGSQEDQPWYRAWCDRVYLANCDPSGDRDVLASALAYSADSAADLDPAVFERDLNALLSIAAESGNAGFGICIDDAEPLTEDVQLVEELQGSLDAVGGFVFLMAGGTSCAKHFVEAASPCLTRMRPIHLHPFRGPTNVYNALAGPLPAAEKEWVAPDHFDFLRDVIHLTSGNPYEIMLVAHYLWATCRIGDQERYTLTPRVLDRVIPHLSLLAAGGDALRDGAAAIDLLPEEQISQAVELASMAHFTVDQIAVVRLLKLPATGTERLDRSIVVADRSAEVERIKEELIELEKRGVVELRDDGETFNLVGGRPASVLLRYKARARGGPGFSDQPFELGFLFTVGRALVRDALHLTTEAVEGSESIGFSAIGSPGGAGRLSPRPVVRMLEGSEVDLSRLADAEIDLIPWGSSGLKLASELLKAPDPRVAVIDTELGINGERLEYLEMWRLEDGTSQETLVEKWASVAEDWEPVAEASGISWEGTDVAVVSGARAKQVLILMQPVAAANAVLELFSEWRTGRAEAVLMDAVALAEDTVQAMRLGEVVDAQVAGEFSRMLSRSGFIKSLANQLEGASSDLEEALARGAADGWVTKWNLMSNNARHGDRQRALDLLVEIETEVAGWAGSAFVAIFIPEVEALESVLNVTDGGIDALLGLQRAILEELPSREVITAVDACRETGDGGAAFAAELVAQRLPRAA